MIPQLVHGSIRIKDVCTNCNSHLGSDVDHLILSEPRLVRTILYDLELPGLKDRILERSQTTLKDVSSGAEYAASIKSGRVRMIPQCDENDFWTVSEENLSEILGGQLRKRPPGDLEPKEASQRFENLKAKYAAIGTGESVKDPELSLEIKKGSASIHHQIRTDGFSGHRLAAKIAYEVVHYLIPPDRLDDYNNDLEKLRMLALTGVGIHDEVILGPPAPRKSEYAHTILVHFEKSYTAIDIYMFGTVSYRVMLYGGGEQRHRPVVDEGEAIDIAGLRMTFTPNEPIQKYFVRRVLGDSTLTIFQSDFI